MQRPAKLAIGWRLPQARRLCMIGADTNNGRGEDAMALDERDAWVARVLGVGVTAFTAALDGPDLTLGERLKAAGATMQALKAEGVPELPTLLAAFQARAGRGRQERRPRLGRLARDGDRPRAVGGPRPRCRAGERPRHRLPEAAAPVADRAGPGARGARRTRPRPSGHARRARRPPHRPGPGGGRQAAGPDTGPRCPARGPAGRGDQRRNRRGHRPGCARRRGGIPPADRRCGPPPRDRGLCTTPCRQPRGGQHPGRRAGRDCQGLAAAR